MSIRKLILCITPIIILPSVLYGATAADLLKKAQDADKRLSYRGMKTATVYYGDRPVNAVLKVVHMKPDRTRTEYYSPLPLAGILLIQDGPDVWRFRPEQRIWEQVHSSSAMPSDPNRQGAFDNYSIQLVGVERVAGRDAYEIRAIPKRMGEALHRIWIDRQCYLITGTQMENAHGVIINSSRFTSIEINPSDIPGAAFQLNGKIKSPPRPKSVDFRIERPTYIPKGYKLVGVVRISVNDHCCVHLQYSNGVNTISLFERRADDKSAPPQLPSKVTTVLTWTRNGMLYTLVGDVSRSELQKVAHSTK